MGGSSISDVLAPSHASVQDTRTQIKTELLGTAIQLALPNAIQKLALLFILEEPWLYAEEEYAALDKHILIWSVDINN